MSRNEYIYWNILYDGALFSLTEPLTVFINPQRQVVDVGKTVRLNCFISGGPQEHILWMKDGEVIKNSSMTLQLNKTSLLIATFERSDKGMYQCFASNEFEVRQGSAQLLLGGNSPLETY